MKDRKIPWIHDEPAGDGLHYSERQEPSRFGGAVRICVLRPEESDLPVSSLRLFPFRQRFGATPVAVEGFGGVSTLPEHRGQGHIRRLIDLVLARLRRRVDAAFLFGVEGLYGRFGFTSCLDEYSISLWVRRADDLAAGRKPRLEAVGADELPRIVDLFNSVNRTRGWTIDRERERWNRVRRHQVWEPGSTVYRLVEEDDPSSLRAYAVFRDTTFGVPRRELVIEEACADGIDSARRLLSALGHLAHRDYLETLTIQEPPDSPVGMAARGIGCSVTRRSSANGGGMGVVLNRAGLVDSLTDEFARRMGTPEGNPTANHSSALITGLREGTIVPDNGELLRLLVGYWSLHDLAMEHGDTVESYPEELAAWFPGGGTALLPLPYAHELDRY